MVPTRSLLTGRSFLLLGTRSGLDRKLSVEATNKPSELYPNDPAFGSPYGTDRFNFHERAGLQCKGLGNRKSFVTEYRLYLSTVGPGVTFDLLWKKKFNRVGLWHNSPQDHDDQKETGLKDFRQYTAPLRPTILTAMSVSVFSETIRRFNRLTILAQHLANAAVHIGRIRRGSVLWSLRQYFGKASALEQVLVSFQGDDYYDYESEADNDDDDDDPYCESCSRIFVNKEALYQHLGASSLHNWCFICSRDFRSPQA
ncbi:hypothetical protein BDZ89DRAFT_1182806 [Hymenopellis radicata]|nr:hypothetical protein BDZ89DRAFT_1182806 [Hymenopellis radicata]